MKSNNQMPGNPQPDSQRKNRPKNPAAVILGRLGGRAPKRKPYGLGAVSQEKRKEVSRLGVEARKRKRARTQAA